MKIGIITFHFGDNYGAVLQTAATFSYLEAQGHEPVVLDFLPFEGRQEPLLRNWRFRGDLKAGIKRKLGKYFTCRKAGARFEDFRNRAFKRSRTCRTLAELADVSGSLDAVITGSDQVWHFDRALAYFLAWDSPNHFKRIAYAPCCATDDQDYVKGRRLVEHLARFDAISVRDTFSQRAIKKLTDKEPEVVCDPTLLLPLEAQESGRFSDEKYLLTYILGDPDPQVLKKAIQKLRESTGVEHVKAIVGPALQNWRSPQEADEVLWGPHPGDWLSLIKNCAALLTDSFHGCLFAIKYEVPFIGFYQEALRAPRLIDLEERYGMADHICATDELAQKCLQGPVSASPFTQQLIGQHVEESRAFLSSALS